MTWRSWRRVAAVSQTAAVVSLPFVRVGGDSALRFDVPTASLRVLGRVVRLDEFHLVLLALLFLAAVLVGATAILGRAWCGWLCGQTLLPELASWAATPLPPRARRPAADVALLALSALVSFSLLCFVLPPAEAARALSRSPTAAGLFFVQWAAVFGMTALWGTRFCATVCPYAMLQNVLFDDETLAIRFDRRRADDCLGCAACAAVCPAGIDIRDGLARQCIACARCADACEAATRPRRIEPFVGYAGRILRPKSALFAGLAAAAAAGLALAVALQPPADGWLRWEGPVPGARVDRYAWRVANNSGRPLPVGLRVEGGGTLIGDREAVVAPWSRREGRVMVRRSEAGAAVAVLVLFAPGLDLRSAVPAS